MPVETMPGPSPKTPVGGADLTGKPPMPGLPSLTQGRPTNVSGTAPPMPGTQPIDPTGGMKTATSPTNPGPQNWMSQPPSWYNQPPGWYNNNGNTNEYTKPPVTAQPPAPPKTPAPPHPIPMPTNPQAGTMPGTGSSTAVGAPTGTAPTGPRVGVEPAVSAATKSRFFPTNGTNAAGSLNNASTMQDYMAARHAQSVGSLGTTSPSGKQFGGSPQPGGGLIGSKQGNRIDPTAAQEQYIPPGQKGAPSTPMQRAMQQSGQSNAQLMQNGFQNLGPAGGKLPNRTKPGTAKKIAAPPPIEDTGGAPAKAGPIKANIKKTANMKATAGGKRGAGGAKTGK